MILVDKLKFAPAPVSLKIPGSGIFLPDSGAQKTEAGPKNKKLETGSNDC